MADRLAFHRVPFHVLIDYPIPLPNYIVAFLQLI